MSTQLALFFILSGIPNPQPESSSSTADLITMLTTEDKHKTFGMPELAFKHVILSGYFKFHQKFPNSQFQFQLQKARIFNVKINYMI